MAILLKAMWSERGTQKIKALFARLLDAGLRLIPSKSQARRHRPRPIQRLRRLRPTENHKIIRVVDDMRLELLPRLVIRQPFNKRFMYGLASIGLA